MKVIDKGTWNNPWSEELICKTCNAKVLVEESDLLPCPDAKTNFWVCCECGKGNDVEHLPLRVLEELNSKRKYSDYLD